MPLKYRIEYKVRGQTRFPMDMLRYDRCNPLTEADAALIERHVQCAAEPECQIDLVTFSETKAYKPTQDRWRSFGWTVVPGSLRVSKLP
jgi:hypothetical protein